MNTKYQASPDCKAIAKILVVVVGKLTHAKRGLQLAGVAQGRKNPLWMGLPERLYRARSRANLSQSEVARRGRISSGVLSRTEAGLQAPTIKTVERLAAGLGLPVGWIAFGHEGEEPFLKKRPRSPLPPDDPEPESGHGIFRGRYQGCGERARQVREQLGLSLRELAQKATAKVAELKLSSPRVVSHQAVLFIETSASVPHIDTIEFLAMALEVSPSWLAFGDEEVLDHVRNLDQVSSSPLDEKATQREGK